VNTESALGRIRRGKDDISRFNGDSGPYLLSRRGGMSRAGDGVLVYQRTNIKPTSRHAFERSRRKLIVATPESSTGSAQLSNSIAVEWGPSLDHPASRTGPIV